MGNWHPYNRIDPDQPQTRIVFLAGNQGGMNTEDDDDADYGYDAEYGLGGDACVHNMARYVAVAPTQCVCQFAKPGFRGLSVHRPAALLRYQGWTCLNRRRYGETCNRVLRPFES